MIFIAKQSARSGRRSAICRSGLSDDPISFRRNHAPEFAMEARWNLPQLLGYLRTWSATQKFIAVRGYDPVDSLGDELRSFWKKADETRSADAMAAQ